MVAILRKISSVTQGRRLFGVLPGEKQVSVRRLCEVEVTGYDDGQVSGYLAYPINQELGTLFPRPLTTMIEMSIEHAEYLLRLFIPE